MLTPDDTEALELSPHPGVPPTDIVPASLVLITTFGLALFVGVTTGVCSVGAETVGAGVGEWVGGFSQHLSPHLENPSGHDLHHRSTMEPPHIEELVPPQLSQSLSSRRACGLG